MGAPIHCPLNWARRGHVAKASEQFLSSKSFRWLWCTDRCKNRERSYRPHYWSTEPLIPWSMASQHTNIKVDVTWCMVFLRKGLWELPIQMWAVSPPCTHCRGNGRRETPRVGIKTVFISSFLFVTWSFCSKRKKKNTTTKNPAAPGFLHKCSLALQLVHLLATLNSRKYGSLSL